MDLLDQIWMEIKAHAVWGPCAAVPVQPAQKVALGDSRPLRRDAKL